VERNLAAGDTAGGRHRFRLLAGRFRLTGGNIQNVALAAAFLAAQAGGVVSLVHVPRAIERDFDKMGKSVSSDELMAELRALDRF